MAQLRSKLHDKQLMEKMQDQKALAKSKDEITRGGGFVLVYWTNRASRI